MIKIIVDCFGGDNSPEAQVEGSLTALDRFEDLSVILTGDETVLSDCLKDRKYGAGRIQIIHAPEVIGCDEKPTDAIRFKKASSLMTGIRMLREDEKIAGMVSCGSTGALVAASTLRIGRLRGVIRPAFCPVVPTMNGSLCGICDSGANVDITPEYLLQFAVMGSLYMKHVYGVEDPKVALLNIGTEEGKGDELRKQAYELLKNTEGINFTGNIEARDFLSGKANLIVCDGFSGNVLIKSTEGAMLELLKRLKSDISSKFRYKIGALFMYRMFMEEKEFMNYQNYGGSVMLGLTRVIVKGHGSSKSEAVAKCIEQAYRMRSAGLAELTEKLLSDNAIKKTEDR